MSLTRPIIALLAAFQPVFTRLTWQKARVLLVGALLTRGWRTVTIALPQMRLEDSPQFSEYHQVLNHAQWSPLQLSWCLLNLFVKAFVHAGGALEIMIDETLERRKGGFTSANTPSTHDHRKSEVGYAFACMTLFVTLPCMQWPLGPTLFVQYPKSWYWTAALATNILCFVQWRTGTPWAKTRISRFTALAA